MTDSKVALIDMDGTLCDYEGALKEAMEITFNRLMDDAEVWSDEHAGVRHLIKRQTNFWRDLKPIARGFSVTIMLEGYGFNLHVLTKGPAKIRTAWTEKLDWCRDYLGDDVPVTITEDKSLTYGRILFDDYPPYCRAWLAHRPRGLVLMLAYPYNEGFEEEFPGQVVRVTGKNWEEVEAAIKQQSERK